MFGLHGQLTASYILNTVNVFWRQHGKDKNYRKVSLKICPKLNMIESVTRSDNESDIASVAKARHHRIF